jgi:hypothetical protein
MEEFIAQHKLGVDIGNPQATRLVAKKLKELGYRQERRGSRGTRQIVWTNEPNTMEELKSKLASLKL